MAGAPSNSWLRRNWVLVVLLILGAAGTIAAFANFFVPCPMVLDFTPRAVRITTEVSEEVEFITVQNVTTTTEREVITFENITSLVNITISRPVNFTMLNPLRMVIAVDGSGSTQLAGFEKEILAVASIIEIIGLSFTENVTTNLIPGGSDSFFQAGLTQWNNLPAVVHYNITDNEGLPKRIRDDYAAGKIIYQRKGTQFAQAQMECIMQLEKSRSLDDSRPIDSLEVQEICLIASDGQNNDNGFDFDVASISGLAIADGPCAGAGNTDGQGNPGGDVNSCKAEALQVKQFCDDRLINPCNTGTINNFGKAEGLTFIGIYIGTVLVARDQLYAVSSCSDIMGSPTFDSTCPLFATTSFDNLTETANALVEELTKALNATEVSFEEAVVMETVNTTEIKVVEIIEEQNVTQVELVDTRQQISTAVNETFVVPSAPVCTGTPFWWFLIFLLVPLLAYLLWRPISLFLTNYFCPPLPYEPPHEMSMYKPGPRVMLAAVPKVQVMESRALPPAPVPLKIRKKKRKLKIPPPIAPLPTPPANVLKVEKRYRWSVKAADKYLWNLGAAGVAPMHVNFAGVAPPSAPKENMAVPSNMRRHTQRLSLRWSREDLLDGEEGSEGDSKDGEKGDEALAVVVGEGAEEEESASSSEYDSDMYEYYTTTDTEAEAEAEAERQAIREKEEKELALAAAAEAKRLLPKKSVLTRVMSTLGPTTQFGPRGERDYNADDTQPGDIDYEYTMCLMQWFPCLRPRNGGEGDARMSRKSYTQRASGRQNEYRDTISAQARKSEYRNTVDRALLSPATVEPVLEADDEQDSDSDSDSDDDDDDTDSDGSISNDSFASTSNTDESTSLNRTSTIRSTISSFPSLASNTGTTKVSEKSATYEWSSSDLVMDENGMGSNSSESVISITGSRSSISGKSSSVSEDSEGSGTTDKIKLTHMSSESSMM